MNIEFGYGVRSKQLEKLILSKPDIFDGWYDNVDPEDRIYEVSMRMGYNIDGVHSIYGDIRYILGETKRIKKCDSHNCNLDECKEKRKG